MADIHTLSNPYVTPSHHFILACFVGYYVVWKVTPALHTPLCQLRMLFLVLLFSVH